MKVIILCGGQGTRLREETEFRPKPLVSVGEKPILWHIMKLFSTAGLRDFVLCLGYRGNMIKEYFLNYEAMNNDFTICLGKKNAIHYHDEHEEQDFHVCLAETGPETMTGGRLKRVARYVDDETFMMTYGDGLADVDVKALLAFHHSHGKIGTVTTVRPVSRFGILDLGDNGEVSRFAEKPQASGWANAGFFVFNRRIFDYLANESDDCIFERGPLERLVADGELMAFRHNGFFFAMDTYREYQYLNDLWNKGEAPWKVWK
jgi:glucose-1-phosphate cytidylyltransferase